MQQIVDLAPKDAVHLSKLYLTNERASVILKKPEDMNRLFAEAFNSGDVESVLALYY
jgi:hypothetical protein